MADWLNETAYRLSPKPDGDSQRIAEHCGWVKNEHGHGHIWDK
jgi:hypothetical protein